VEKNFCYVKYPKLPGLGTSTGRAALGHKLIFQIVMYTTPKLGYSDTQLVAQVT